MTTRAIKAIETAREILKAHGFFVDNLWHVDDIHFICEQRQLPAITDDEAMQVLTIANTQFDGETGLSWPQLERALLIFLKRRQLLANMLQQSAA
jgi:hypothetical protein